MIPESGRSADLHLRLTGERVSFHFYAVCEWLAGGLRHRCGPGARFDVIGDVPGKKTNIDSVLDGSTDVSLTTPIATAAMAHDGRGMFSEPHPELRAIAALPHRDRLVFAIAADVAAGNYLRTFADLRDRRPALRIIAGINDGTNQVGFAIDKVLEQYGMRWRDIERWGGRWIPYRGPDHATELLVSGEADGIFQEAFMTWHDFAEARLLRFLSIDPGILAALRSQYGYRRADLEPGEMHGVNTTVATLDWSQWLIIVRRDMDDRTAQLLASVVVEDRATLEAGYRHLPVPRSALTYPIRPEDVWRTAPVPLHPGASEYYDALGVRGDQVA